MPRTERRAGTSHAAAAVIARTNGRATGQLTAPLAPGFYSLTASNVVANVIRQGETGDPFWRVERTTPGNMTFLIVQVAADAPSARGRR